MGTKVIGKLDSWTDGDVGNGESSFMRLEEGDSSIRVLTSPYQFYSHWSVDATGAQRNVRCAVNNCPICARGEKASARWYVGVINRKTQKPAILEIGSQIFTQILALSKKPAWGDVRGYDLTIERRPKGSQPLYNTTPEPKEKLTDEEKATAKEFLAKMDLAKMVLAPTPEEVAAKIGITLEAPKPAPQVSNDFEAAEEPKETATDDDDFQF
jgi:hypothetical protein